METEKRCMDCIWFMADDGEPYYCLNQDLYTFVTPNDEACEDFQEVEKSLQNL